MVPGPEGGWQIHINPEIYNSVSPEVVAIKSFTPDIWREGDKGAAGKSCRGTVKQKKRDLTNCRAHYKEAWPGHYLWLDADWQAGRQAGRIAVLAPPRLRPVSSAHHLAGSSSPVSDAAGS